MSEPTIADLLDIVADLKDRVIEQDEKLETYREQIALLSEAIDQLAPQPFTSHSVDLPEFMKAEAA